jgi:uncharacterized paraquat-inducible protein A
MPYTHCPSCRLSTFTAAGHSSRDECPRCGTELTAQPRSLFFARDADSAREPSRLQSPPTAA